MEDEPGYGGYFATFVEPYGTEDAEREFSRRYQQDDCGIWAEQILNTIMGG
jgi:hypothetical protein